MTIQRHIKCYDCYHCHYRTTHDKCLQTCVVSRPKPEGNEQGTNYTPSDSFLAKTIRVIFSGVNLRGNSAGAWCT